MNWFVAGLSVQRYTSTVVDEHDRDSNVMLADDDYSQQCKSRRAVV